ncbi:MAG: universal stress protein [Methanothrix sp.]|jgi:nucleotide-binding universal stress UspA family protein|nr:universal stress protein [Methanothrix sp.]
MIKNIMIATDGSDASKKAAEVGIEIAGRSKGSIIAVYVVDVFRLSRIPGYATFPGLKDKLLELMEKEGIEATESIEDMANIAGISCQKLITRGDPSKELLRVSMESGVDLLIMGSIGRTGLDRIILGGVAEKVVRNSEVPVLLVP